MNIPIMTEALGKMWTDCARWKAVAEETKDERDLRDACAALSILRIIFQEVNIKAEVLTGGDGVVEGIELTIHPGSESRIKERYYV